MRPECSGSVLKIRAVHLVLLQRETLCEHLIQAFSRKCGAYNGLRPWMLQYMFLLSHAHMHGHEAGPVFQGEKFCSETYFTTH